MRVVTLTQELNDTGDLLRVAEEEESEGGHGRSTNVVRDVRNCNVEELANRRVRSCSGVGESESVHSSVSKDSVLSFDTVRNPIGIAGASSTYSIAQQALDHLVRLFLLSIKHERDSDGQSSNDLLVLSLVRVLDHLVEGLCRSRSEHDESHRVPSSFTCDGRVVEEYVSKGVVDFCIAFNRGMIRSSAGQARRKERGDDVPSFPLPIAATPNPRAAPCIMTSS